MEKRMNKWIGSFAVLVFLSAPAFAATDSATLALTGTVVSSVGVTLATGTAGATLGGTPKAGTLAMGTFGRQTAISGWTQTTTGNDYTFTTPVNVAIDAANTTSTAATVSAYMTTAPATGVTYSFGGTTVTSSTPGTPTAIAATIYSLNATTQNYGADNNVAVTIADSFAAASISNTYNLTVTVN
jgi:hypothetical protein